jgi:relaxase-like protein
MIVRLMRSRDFGGTVRYCQQKAVGQRPMASSLVLEAPNGHTAEEVIDHLRPLSSTRKPERPVVHISVRIRDGARLSEEQWLLVIERLRFETGFESCPWVAYLHNNEGGREGQHAHLILSRVSFYDGIVSDRNDRSRVMDVKRSLEHDLGL